MAFMVLSIQKSMLVQEQSQLEYQETVASSKYEYVTSALSTLENADAESNEVKQLEAYQELYKSQQTQIESRLKVIENQISSYDKAVDTNIKNDCKFSITA